MVLKTTATLEGDEYVVNAEKLFITNVVPGRTVVLVVLIDNKPARLIADLPPENEHFAVVPYGTPTRCGRRTTTACVSTTSVCRAATCSSRCWATA